MYHIYFGGYAVFSMDMQFFSMDMQFFSWICNFLWQICIFRFVYKIKPFPSGHMVHVPGQ